MRKLKVFWDFEKEEEFLNNMALKGYIFEKRSIWGIYHFRKEKSKKMNYRIDCKKFKNRKAYNDYIALFEDAGWIHVSGEYYTNTQYFLQGCNAVDDDIFSDMESAARRYKTFQEICYSNFTIFVAYLVIFASSDKSYWSTWGFLTPGLWEMKGKQFLSAFIFELPFAFCRVALPFILLIMGIAFGYLASKSRKIYKEKTKNIKSI